MKKIDQVSLYVMDGSVYVPRVFQTTRGWLVEQEPVRVFGVGERDALVRVVVEELTLAKGLVDAAAGKGTPVVVKAAKMRSWSAFEKRAAAFAVLRTDDKYVIPHLVRVDRGFEWASKEAFPLSTPVEEVARRVVDIALAGHG